MAIVTFVERSVGQWRIESPSSDRESYPSRRYTTTTIQQLLVLILLPSSRRGEEKEGILLPIVDRRYSILILERG